MGEPCPKQERINGQVISHGLTPGQYADLLQRDATAPVDP